jgi:archaellin
MITQPPRSYTKLAVAIILAAVLVSATLFLAIAGTKTVTETTTQATTTTVTSVVTVVTNSLGQSYSMVTVTRETVIVYPVLPYCTTVSGTATVAYSEAVGGTTTVTYLYPTSYLNSSFYATLVTASMAGASFQTESSSISC